MKIHKIAAFSINGEGGNPAGVVLAEAEMAEDDMARIAAEVGYSETAFANPTGNDQARWRVRYFSPESEVPFCGHATIALGAVLGGKFGAGVYHLELNDASISVEAFADGDGMRARLASPATRSQPASADERGASLALFGLSEEDLDDRLPPARIRAGADHIMLALKDRGRLAAMNYDLDEGRALMRRHDLTTIMLVYIAGDQLFEVRNAFASGGVLEDPATGAAAAAFAGLLRDCSWPHGGGITIHQGRDMGVPSLIQVGLSGEAGAPVDVEGRTRVIG